jgi:hypothetical protein
MILPPAREKYFPELAGVFRANRLTRQHWASSRHSDYRRLSGYAVKKILLVVAVANPTYQFQCAA